MPTQFEDCKTEDDVRALIAVHEQAKQPFGIDYGKSKSFQDAAIYTPAMSSGYIASVATLEQQQADAKTSGNPLDDPFYQMNPNFLFGADDLKFIKRSSKLCFYPWHLYSAGQGAKTVNMAKQTDWLTQTPREQGVVLLGDSSGFQLQQQTIPFDPAKTPERMLRWLERVADYSMTLDFPTGGIDKGSMVPHIERLKAEGIAVLGQAKAHGFSTGYTACFIRTLQNNQYFASNRKRGATNFLNVIQGRNEEESQFWYNQVKRFPFEGWAFAGKHSVQLSMTLRRLIQMRDDNLLEPDQWFHFLGVSTLKVGAALTYIKRALSKHTEAERASVTFDSSSPVETLANGYKAVSGYQLGNKNWHLRTEATNLTEHLKSNRTLHQLSYEWVMDDEHRMAATSTLSNALKLSDLVGERNVKKGRRIPNKLQQTLLIHHNTQAMIEAFREAYTYLDEKYQGDRPQSIQFLDHYIDYIFTTQNPMSVIDEIEAELDALAYEGVFGR